MEVREDDHHQFVSSGLRGRGDGGVLQYDKSATSGRKTDDRDGR